MSRSGFLLKYVIETLEASLSGNAAKERNQFVTFKSAFDVIASHSSVQKESRRRKMKSKIKMKYKCFCFLRNLVMITINVNSYLREISSWRNTRCVGA